MRTETTRPRPNRKPRPATTPKKRATRRKTSADSDVTIRKRGKIYFMYHKRRWRVPWRLCISLVVIFICGLGVTVSFARIHSLERQITQTRARLDSQIETNVSLEATAVGRYNREMIEMRARELGLSEPDPSQIIYFYTPHLASHVVITYDRVLPQENYFWQGIRDFFGDIVDRIFG